MHHSPFRAAGLLLIVSSSALGGQETFKLLPSDGASMDQFGISVALSGSTAIVGAWRHADNGAESGSAYLFDVTTGQQVAELLPSDGATEDVFGYSVGISGSTAIIGAYRDDDSGSNSGSAYLFDVATGQQIGKLLPSDGAAGDLFGRTVAISEGTAIVGADYDDDNGDTSGSAYLFDVATGQQAAKLLPSGGAEHDHFGISVAISGNTAIVGAPGADHNGLSAGSAYLFDVTTGQQIAMLLASDGEAWDGFGLSVAISGSTAIVGAYGDDDNGISSGSAYLFDVATGQQIAKLVPSDGETYDLFGASVALTAGVAMVGADGDDDLGNASGSVYLFDVATGQQIAKLLPSDGAAFDEFGSSVALSGSTLVVGASRDNGAGLNDGSAYVFGLAQSPWIISPVNGHWYLGLSPDTWTDAEAEAQGFGGHLATVLSQAENDWLLTNFASTEGVWIGYTDQANEGSFEWISGEPTGYENWATGEPDDGSGADWAVIQSGSGMWTDETQLPMHRGVVEVISADCDGDDYPDTYQIAQEPWLDWNGDGVLDDCVSANYCSAAMNSAGAPALIGAGGTPIVADNDFTLEAASLPLNEFGYFLMSESTAFVQGFGGSAGNLCLGAPIVRFNLGGQVVNSGTTGMVGLDLDLTSLPQGAVFLPGNTWYFQFWFRDVATSNTSDGIEVMFR